MNKKIIIPLVLVSLVLVVSGCISNRFVTGNISLDKYEISRNDIVEMTLSLDIYPGIGKESYLVEFVTSDRLEIRKDRNGKAIIKDVLYDVVSREEEKYYVAVKSYSLQQEITSIEAIIKSKDEKAGFVSIKSDFIIIRGG